MFRSLFARLTGEPKRGERLFASAVAEARSPHWYIDGEVPDTINGRFAVLATVVAMTIVRLEQAGAEGEAASVALTERMVESLDVEVREMGVSDPTIGKQVRKLVGALAARVERWRRLTACDDSWTEDVKRSLYLDDEAEPAAVAHSETALKAYWARLRELSMEDLAEGSLA
jgi:cytochrome b pre-mRNA-processing protein 3